MRNTTERRNQILIALCEKRKEKIPVLAQEFEVSERTIRRDIEILSLIAPLITIRGIYGGVEVQKGYSINRIYLSQDEKELIVLLISFCNQCIVISERQVEILKALLRKYTLHDD